MSAAKNTSGPRLTSALVERTRLGTNGIKCSHAGWAGAGSGVRSTACLFNGDIVYWSQRLRQHPLTTGRIAILLRRQQGRCAWCGSLFLNRTDIEVDHVHPRIFNGTTDLTNLQLLHGHCHDQKSVLDGSAIRRRQTGLHAKNRVTEEPNAAKAHVRIADESFP